MAFPWRRPVPGALSALAGAAQAHHPESSAAFAVSAGAWGWSLEPWLVALLVAAGVLYARGAWKLWTKAGAGRGIGFRAAMAFAAGWLTLVAALVSPLDRLGGTAFSMHMLQHELLMVVAAPLLVAGRPLEAWSWGLAPAWRRFFAQATRARALRRAWGALTDPIGAWAVHALALWAWHIPPLFQWALANEGAHILQHTSFLGSALLFWWAVLGGASRRAGGASLLALFTTMLHTSALGALLTFSPSVWYAHPAGGPETLGLDPLADQQLGGLIMWVPGGLAYIVTALAIVARWLAERPAALRVRE
jgi:putative membrane protein